MNRGHSSGKCRHQLHDRHDRQLNKGRRCLLDAGLSCHSQVNLSIHSVDLSSDSENSIYVLVQGPCLQNPVVHCHPWKDVQCWHSPAAVVWPSTDNRLWVRSRSYTLKNSTLSRHVFAQCYFCGWVCASTVKGPFEGVTGIQKIIDLYAFPSSILC